MLIDFSCPVCEAALAIERQATGGQVNCPKCSKLILLPLESTLARKEKETAPFQPGASYMVKEITRAICKSVEPYRKDLEKKSELLNDAVEMVKIRNERIKEVETLMLNTQSELWALEAEMDELEDGEDPEKLEELQGENQELTTKKDRLDSKLHHMVTHTEQLDQHLKVHWHMVENILQELEAVESQFHSQTTLLASSDEVQDEAKACLQKVTKELEWCAGKIKDMDKARSAAEKAVGETKELLDKTEAERDTWKDKAASLDQQLTDQDIEAVVQERDTWKQKAEELEKKLAQQDQVTEKLNSKLAKTEEMKSKQVKERENAKNFREEMKANMKLLREQLEQERKSHQEALTKQEAGLKSNHTNEISTLEKEVRKVQEHLQKSESKIKEHLQTEKDLSSQHKEVEQALATLEKQLSEAQKRLQSLT